MGDKAEKKEKSKQCSINISEASCGKGLRDKLQDEAAKKGLSLSNLVRKIFIWAVDNQSKLENGLSKARSKPGERISTTVSVEVRDALNDWASATDRKRSLLCCYILEKVLEENLLREVLRETKKKPADES